MKKIWPHELFRMDFDQIMEEGKRQEKIYSGNIGEASIVKEMHTFFSEDVLQVILADDRVYEASERFAGEYAKDCFRNLLLGGKEIYNTQQKLLEIKERVVDFLARAEIAGLASLDGTSQLTKSSDFIQLLKFGEMNGKLQKRALKLADKAKEHEDLQVRVVLRGIRDCYEMVFPRVMFVVRCAMKFTLTQPPTKSDEKLLSPSDYIDWLVSNTDNSHVLNKVFVGQREFYRAARNVGNHHQGLEWISNKDTVVLPDLADNKIRVHVDEFHQRFRFLVHFCDLGVRGILSAFCERDQGATANKLAKEYANTFPSGWTGGVKGAVTLYSVSRKDSELISEYS